MDVSARDCRLYEGHSYGFFLVCLGLIGVHFGRRRNPGCFNVGARVCPHLPFFLSTIVVNRCLLSSSPASPRQLSSAFPEIMMDSAGETYLTDEQRRRQMADPFELSEAEAFWVHY